MPTVNEYDPDGLNPEQRHAYDAIVESNVNVLVDGPAGSGKSHLIHTLSHTLGDKVLVCASTGKAAVAIGGVTVHKGVGLGRVDPESDDVKPVAIRIAARLKKNAYTRADLCAYTHLILDEASMISVYMMILLEDRKSTRLNSSHVD